MTTSNQPALVFLKDYRQPSHWIEQTFLDVRIFDGHTLVESTLSIRYNERVGESRLVLQGEELELRELELDGQLLNADQYVLDDHSLSLSGLSGEHQLRILTRIYPDTNTSLEGLYKSRLMYCTQCEAEGFRKITYYLDRPDVLSVFTTRIEADKSTFPILLANGNPSAEGDLPGGRHWAEWHDPFPKPSYLFALVAGRLSVINDEFVTGSGRHVQLQVYVEDKDLDKCEHAINSLKKAMRWDEDVYGREYDLDRFMIVAVDDFNMGAMENKGLNIFNTSCVLAHPSTSTDAEFQRVEGVVAHEYFHNWSGNRVTCRDWFQLSLKEGFTVFRDSEFSADMGSRTVKRVEDVNVLRSLQFAEDAGPMAHAVQPASFIEISNFYTLTIYEKGAEIVRMLHILLGPALFRQGTDLYFSRHDGQAVTIDDFVAAMAEVSGRDFSQFMRWYRQAGTPTLKVRQDYDPEAKTCRLSFEQSCRETPETETKQPYVIPVALALVGEHGKLPMTLAEADSETTTERVIEITEASQTMTFSQIDEKPVPSLLRGFSAPVSLEYAYTDTELLRLALRDDDGFCRWDAAQKLITTEIQRVQGLLSTDPAPAVSEHVLRLYGELLADPSLDPAMVALMLTLPTEKYLAEQVARVDVEGIHHARNTVARKLAKSLRSSWLEIYERLSELTYSSSGDAIAKRSLKNLALHFIALESDAEALSLVETQFNAADNMTDELAAFRALVHSTRTSWQSTRASALQRFYNKWQREALVMNHWFAVQATQPRRDCLQHVEVLMQDSGFDAANPNKIRALIGNFCNNNPISFHSADGSGYRFLGEQVLRLNRLNPQIASRLLVPLSRWKHYDEQRKSHMESVIRTISDDPGLSSDVYELISKILSDT